MPRIARLAVPAVLAAFTLSLFDLVAWFAAPASLTRFAVNYRKPQILEGGVAAYPQLARSDPRYYFRADDTMGFDINPGARMEYDFGETPSEIFANSLGCFDRNEVEAFRRAPEYTYFAGDSFTWGFADYDSKFATVWERATGKMAAKCGISHTGQRHQLEKMKRVAAAIGKMPATVFVGYYVNDPANDAAYPHSTVVEGFMVDTAYVKDGELVHQDMAELKATVTASLRKLETPPTGLERLKAFVWVYSLSANIAERALARLIGAFESAAPVAAPSPAQGARAGKAPRPASANLYYWHQPRTIKTAFATDPKTEANREAILAWARHAREHGYRLVFLLFPPKEFHADTEFFGQVRGFLAANNVEHLDFAPLFKAEGLRSEDLYWETNGHWNPNGNRVVGRLLAQRYPGS